jgi:hypothetical protein
MKIRAEEQKSDALFIRLSKALDRATVPVRNCKLTVNLMALPCAVASFRQFTLGLE